MGPRSPLDSNDKSIRPSCNCQRFPSRTCTSGSPNHEALRPALAWPGHIELGGDDRRTLGERFPTVRRYTCSREVARHRLSLSASDGAWKLCPARVKGAARFRSSGPWVMARLSRAQVVGIHILGWVGNTLNHSISIIWAPTMTEAPPVLPPADGSWPSQSSSSRSARPHA